jgi:hypothetical protein
VCGHPPLPVRTATVDLTVRDTYQELPDENKNKAEDKDKAEDKVEDEDSD